MVYPPSNASGALPRAVPGMPAGRVEGGAPAAGFIVSPSRAPCDVPGTESIAT